VRRRGGSDHRRAFAGRQPLRRPITALPWNTAAQKLADEQETDSKPRLVLLLAPFASIVWGADHEVPFQRRKLPPWSPAMQNFAEAHDTSERPPWPFSIARGADHPLPFQTIALPPTPIAMQNLTEGHETLERPARAPFGSILYPADHEAPFQRRASPSTSKATQKLVEAQETEVVASFGTFGRIVTGADHEVPFQKSALGGGIDRHAESRRETRDGGDATRADPSWGGPLQQS
jgi:hypothetical protein